MVESAQSVETELADPSGAQLAATVPRLGLHALHDLLEAPRIDVPLVGCPEEGGAELLAIERLPVAVALDHLEGLGNSPLIGGEAVATRIALAPPADGAVRNPASLEGSGGGVAARTVHSSESSGGVVLR
jgi:hypothetical protein